MEVHPHTFGVASISKDSTGNLRHSNFGNNVWENTDGEEGRGQIDGYCLRRGLKLGVDRKAFLQILLNVSPLMHLIFVNKVGLLCGRQEFYH